jgi:hypothetical protein
MAAVLNLRYLKNDCSQLTWSLTNRLDERVCPCASAISGAYGPSWRKSRTECGRRAPKSTLPQGLLDVDYIMPDRWYEHLPLDGGPVTHRPHPLRQIGSAPIGGLDLETLVCTFPLSRLESRCPRCGNRRMVVMFEPPPPRRVASA